jgi:ketosteroid isomerase-like protein
MQAAEQENLNVVRAYLLALGLGAVGEQLRDFFCDDAIQVELPNRLNPAGGSSDLATLVKRSVQGKQFLQSQRYDVVSEMAEGERVAVEAIWTGVTALAVGNFTEGQEIRAHFAMFFTFRDGKILSQRNYDCFEPW